MARALEEVATTADQVAVEQRGVARMVRKMQRQRARGWTWSEIVEDGGDVLAVLRESAKTLTVATGKLAATLASGLAGEGASRRGIAARLGISHQRVTALIRNGRRS